MSPLLLTALRVSMITLLITVQVTAAPDGRTLNPQRLTQATLERTWSAPQPVYTKTANRKRSSAQSKPSYGFTDTPMGLLPFASEVRRAKVFPEPLIPVDKVEGPLQRAALARAIRAYEQSGTLENLDPLLAFLDKYPRSPWAPSLLLSMGTIAYETGYFSDALNYWHRSWLAAKDGSDHSSRQIANQAVAEYAKMCARVGRKDDLARIFNQIGGRQFSGDARIKLDNAREGYRAMNVKPGVAFRCGPYALTNIVKDFKPEKRAQIPNFLNQIQSPPRGFSLPEVESMSAQLGLQMQMARRTLGSNIIIPSVMHMKVGHYGALVREEQGRYLLKDPTFGNQTWMSRDAIDAEGSGFFLVPDGSLPEGWQPATPKEAKSIYGKGHSGAGGERETSECDKRSGGNESKCAMATYSFHTLLASLHIEDTPVGYTSARNGEVRVKVAYNQREYDQPLTYSFTNFSPQWVCDWVSYLEDNTSFPGANIKLFQPGGGSELHTGYNSTTQTFDRDVQSAAVLERLTANTYRKVYPNGKEIYYEHYIGTTGTKRKVFMSRIVDPQGNEVSLQYDTNPIYPERLKKLIDATGLETEFFYTYSGEPYLVTSIQDPYQREALFTYQNLNGVVRLVSIEDVYGIISSFGYDTTGGITSLTTPYGTTTFELSDFDLGNFTLIRYIESTDPYGDKERIEYNLSPALTGIPQVLNEPLPNGAIVDFATDDNDDRNSFFWDKQQMNYAAGDYSKAHLYHWIQPTPADSATSILESEKPPLEGRIWYNYPGQNPTQPSIQGDLASPSVVARVVYDDQGNLQTQASQYEYNALGNPTKTIDPLGRETRIEYDTNGIDVLSVKQVVSGGSLETLTSYTYDPADPPFRPRTVTDAAGGVTTFSYDTHGQVTTVTNDLSEVITYTYETSPTANGYGKVISITGDVPGGDVTLTYDSFDRVRTATDSEGHVLTYDYDALDRITVITYPDSSTEQFDYQNHSLIAAKDREGRWTRHFYNALNERIATIDPQQRLTQYEWCRCGDIRKLIDGSGNVTEWVRDLQGRPTEKIFHDGTKTQYSYDFAGRLEILTDPSLRTKTHTYHLDNNLKHIDYSDAATPDVSYTYETHYNRLSSMTDGIGTTDYTYHPIDGTTHGAGRIHRVDGPFTDDTVQTTYDELARVQQQDIVDDTTFTTASRSETLAYDAQGRVDTLTNDLGVFDYTYVGQSNRLDTLDYPNGMQVDYTYETANGDFLLQQIKHLNAATTPAVISQFDYTFRQDRNIDTWSVTQNGGTAETWSFAYNASQELARAVRRDSTQTVLASHTYGYDAAGNRVHSASGSTRENTMVNALNQMTEVRGNGSSLFSGTLDEPASVTINGTPARVTAEGSPPEYRFEALVDLAEGSNTITVQATDANSNASTKTYSITANGVSKLLEYDVQGNLRYEKQPDLTVIREYQWDQENRLVKIIDADNSSSEFEYDGLDQRVRIIEKNSSGTTTNNNVFIWCGGLQPCQQRNSSGNTVTRDYFQMGYEESGNDHYYTMDHLGSIREVVEDDGITVEAVYDYSPWGERSLITGTDVSDFGYTSHYLHKTSDLVLTLYRAYDPSSGRWLSRDPIAENGGINLYAYTLNSPANAWDPDGRRTIRFGITGDAKIGYFKGIGGSADGSIAIAIGGKYFIDVGLISQIGNVDADCLSGVVGGDLTIGLNLGGNSAKNLKDLEGSGRQISGELGVIPVAGVPIGVGGSYEENQMADGTIIRGGEIDFSFGPGAAVSSECTETHVLSTNQLIDAVLGFFE